MRAISLADTTLCREDGSFSFKEKIEIARQLERLGVDAIELPEIRNAAADVLLVRTVSSFVKKAVLSVAAGLTAESVENAAAALSAAAHPEIRIELPVSPVGMEYQCHKKPPKMLEWIAQVVKQAREKCERVEFCAVDATRAEPGFLEEALRTALEAGATAITVCDNAAQMLPDDFAAFMGALAKETALPVGVKCDNRHGLAAAAAILACKAGIGKVKTAVGGNVVDLAGFAGLLRDGGENYGLSCGVRYTEMRRIIHQIAWVAQSEGREQSAVPASAAGEGFVLDAKDSLQSVAAAIKKLGYDLSDEDQMKVFEEVRRVAAKKPVGAKELDAIIASTALQVPSAYTLETYVINNGNIISSSAQITLRREGESLQGIALGDGPVDAAFRTIESIIGRHFELDDFQIQAVTEGQEAVGAAVVKLRAGGKLYSGSGISTDIIGASIRAYLGAVNKIVYEEG